LEQCGWLSFVRVSLKINKLEEIKFTIFKLNHSLDQVKNRNWVRDSMAMPVRSPQKKLIETGKSEKRRTGVGKKEDTLIRRIRLPLSG
jgi:hypothetical protein